MSKKKSKKCFNDKHNHGCCKLTDKKIIERINKSRFFLQHPDGENSSDATEYASHLICFFKEI